MNILVTGSNGFLGKHIVSEFKDRFKLITLSRVNADICIDLSSEELTENIEVDTVIHAAGKAHIIPKNESEIKSFYDVNLKGTEKILKKLKNVKNFIFISTVAVYGVEIGENIDELYPLNGETPYAKSKIFAEKLLCEWSKNNNINLLILRLPLLAAKKPPGNLGAMINAIKKKKYFSINGGKARRSIVLVDDIVKWLPSQFGKTGVYNLTDNDNPSFNELEKVICKQLNSRNVLSIPLFFAKILGYFGDVLKLNFVNSYRIKKMTSNLTFSTTKAIEELNWKPQKVKDKFIIN